MDKNLIWYEYGDGISTTKNNKWAKFLYQDFEGTNEIIKNRKKQNANIILKLLFINKMEEEKLELKIK